MEIVILVLSLALVITVIWISRMSRELKQEQFRNRSLSSKYGKLTEQFLPLIDSYPWNSQKFRFLGSPIDGVQVEDDKVIFRDYDIISELTTFIQKHHSFEAEEGCNDDLAMCLVIYAWCVVQDYFKELTEQDVRKRLYEDQREQIEQDMALFGFVLDGLEEDSFVDADGDTWKVDEYGDRSFMWDYR